MAGTANNERIDAYVAETVVGTTPATPAFKKAPFDELQMNGNARISEAQIIAFRGERSAIARNGFVVTGTARGKLFYGEYDDFWRSLYQDDWATDVLVNDTEQYTYTIEQTVPEGAGGTNAYYRYRGVEVVSARIIMTAGQDVEVEFDLIGIGTDASATAIIAGATYADPTNTSIIGSGADISALSFGALDPHDCVRTLTIDFGVADKEEQLRIASDDSCGTSRGRMLPVLTGEFYVEGNANAVYDAMRTGTDFAFSITLGQVANEKYTIEFPSAEFVEASYQTAVSGPMFQPFRILPKYDDGGIDATSRMTRNVA